MAGGDQQDQGLNENLSSRTAATGVKVHMRLDRMMTQLIIEIDASYKQFIEADGSMVVQLDNALYGYVEAAALWYLDLRSKIEKNEFVANPYDACVLNKLGADNGSGARRRPYGDQCQCDQPSIIRAEKGGAL